MSEEVFGMLKSMDRRKIELQIALQCAPTIARLKTSNLLIISREQEDNVRYVLRQHRLLGYRLVYDRNRVVFLVFNKDMLMNYLSHYEVSRFLLEYGYDANDFGKSLRQFKERYDAYVHNRKNFPHEMGVFLGYPLCDVKGFIENGGDGFILSGYWKVYQNLEQARKLFNQFDKVKDDMVRKLYFKGERCHE